MVGSGSHAQTESFGGGVWEPGPDRMLGLWAQWARPRQNPGMVGCGSQAQIHSLKKLRNLIFFCILIIKTHAKQDIWSQPLKQYFLELFHVFMKCLMISANYFNFDSVMFIWCYHRGAPVDNDFCELLRLGFNGVHLAPPSRLANHLRFFDFYSASFIRRVSHLGCH